MTAPTHLRISRNGIEIERAALMDDSVLIGRSPVCDVVLRHPEVRPVHFLLECLKSDDASTIKWALFDVASEAGQETSGSEGVMLGNWTATFRGLEFQLIEDSLASSSFENGLVLSQVESWLAGEVPERRVSPASESLVEIISVRTDTGVVSNVSHWPLRESGTRKFPGTKIAIRWRGHDSEIRWPLALPLRVSQHGRVGSAPNQTNDASSVPLFSQDLLSLEDDQKSYHIRLVSQIPRATQGHDLLKNPVLPWLAAVGAVGILLMFLLSFAPDEPVNKPSPRIAKLILPSAPVTQPAPMKAPKAPEILVKPKPPIAETKPKAPVIEAKPKPTADPQKTRPLVDTKPPAPPKIASNKKPSGNAKPSAPRSVGLLGALAAVPSGPVSVELDPSPKREERNSKQSVPRSQALNLKEDLTFSSSPNALKIAARNLAADTSVSSSRNRVGGSAGQVGQSDLDRLEASSVNGLNISGGEGSAKTKEAVWAQIQKLRPQIRNCLAEAETAGKTISGTLIVEWVIAAGGAVSRFNLVKDTTGSPQLLSCVKELIERSKFPMRNAGGEKRISYPFIFVEGRD